MSDTTKHIDTGASHDAPVSSPKKQPIRAINEDDDGYDPYTDLHDRPHQEPLFERDPWD